MNRSKILASAALALSCAFASAAVVGPAPIDLSTGTASFGSGPLSFASAIGADQLFVFSGLPAQMATYSFEIEGGASGVIRLNSVKLDGVELAGAVVGSKLFSFAADQAFLSGGFTLDVNYDKLAGAASIGGSVTVLPAVPEPETLALMLAGLGMVGLSAMRRHPRG